MAGIFSALLMIIGLIFAQNAPASWPPEEIPANAIGLRDTFVKKNGYPRVSPRPGLLFTGEFGVVDRDTDREYRQPREIIFKALVELPYSQGTLYFRADLTPEQFASVEK